MRSDPIARTQEIAVQPRLGRAGLGLPVVPPGYDWRQRHQDRFGAPARLKAEEGAAVVYQVELDVPPAAVGLETPLPLSEAKLFSSFKNRGIGGNEVIADRADEGKRGIEVLF